MGKGIYLQETHNMLHIIFIGTVKDLIWNDLLVGILLSKSYHGYNTGRGL